jgi:hypothetical protein
MLHHFIRAHMYSITNKSKTCIYNYQDKSKAIWLLYQHPPTFSHWSHNIILSDFHNKSTKIKRLIRLDFHNKSAVKNNDRYIVRHIMLSGNNLPLWYHWEFNTAKYSQDHPTITNRVIPHVHPQLEKLALSTKDIYRSIPILCV